MILTTFPLLRSAARACALMGALLAGACWAADPVSDTVLAPFVGVLNPRGGLVQGKDGSLYGVSQNGGNNGGYGTLYKVASDGTLILLHSFGGTDGNDPEGAPALGKDGSLYGTTYAGGDASPACGTVWRQTPAGAFTTLHSFACNAEGGNLESNVVLAPDGFLYGTAAFGPTSDGVVFRIAPNGKQFSIVASFDTTGQGETVGSPSGGLMLGQDGNFYGAALYCRDSNGNRGEGAIYRVTPAGAIGTVLCFTDGNQNPPAMAPPARDADGNLYIYGPPRNSAMVPVVFRISAGGALSVLHSFDDLSYVCRYGGGSILLDKDARLYGVAGCGGTHDQGFAFSLATDGSDLQVLHNFVDDGVDVTQPNYAIVADIKGQGLWSLSDQGGGGSGWGGVYRLDPPTLSFSAKPKTVAVGHPATLKWSSTDTAECTASGDWAGPMPTSGSVVVTPTEPGTTSYTLTCAGAGSKAKTVKLTAN